jgi:hypothetical protein
MMRTHRLGFLAFISLPNKERSQTMVFDFKWFAGLIALSGISQNDETKLIRRLDFYGNQLAAFPKSWSVALLITFNFALFSLT